MIQPESHPWSDMLGKTVVVDLAASVVYIGTLAAIDDYSLTLADCDVHDLMNTSRQAYLLECRRNGLVPTRKSARMRMASVLGISPLDDVILF